MSDNGIVEELLAEIAELRSLVRTSKVQNNVDSTSNFTTEELEGKLKIRGVLLAEGVWNGVVYPWEEIRKLGESLQNMKLPLIVEHGRDEKYGDRVVGEHTKIKINDFLKALEYEAVVFDDDAIEDIKKGRFNATSMTVEMKMLESSGTQIATNLRGISNSLVENPACKTCYVFTREEMSEPLNSNKHIFTLEVKDMPQIELKENEVLVLPEEDQLFDEETVELEVMPLDEALQNRRAIVYRGPYTGPRTIRRRRGYYYDYYGYPVPYYIWYSPYYGYYPEYGPLSLDESEIVLEKGDTKIVKNKKTGKYVVIQDTGKEGFGKWKILKQFDTEEEAKEYVESLAKVKCPVCGKEFDSEEEMIEHFNKEHAEEYGKYGEGKYPEKKEQSVEELRRKRCSFCGELVDNLEEHLRECKVYNDVVEHQVKCKLCNKTFPSVKELVKHLDECRGYKKYLKSIQNLTDDQPSQEPEQSTPSQSQEPPEEPKTSPPQEPPKEPTQEPSEPKQEPSQSSQPEPTQAPSQPVQSTPPSPQKPVDVNELIDKLANPDSATDLFLMLEKIKREQV